MTCTCLRVYTPHTHDDDCNMSVKGRRVNLPDITTDPTAESDDGSYTTKFLLDWPDWKYVGSVWWDEQGFISTDIWWNKVTRTQWFYQDRNEGRPHPAVVQTTFDGVLRHLGERRLESCDPAIRGLTLEMKIRKHYG